MSLGFLMFIVFSNSCNILYTLTYNQAEVQIQSTFGIDLLNQTPPVIFVDPFGEHMPVRPTSSFTMPRISRVVAIAGATGNLGLMVAKVFLLPQFRTRFHDVIVLARSESPQTRELVSLGAKLRLYSEENLETALRDVDAVVNVYVHAPLAHIANPEMPATKIPHSVSPSGHHFKARLLHCLPLTSVSLYFPSEFGVNHYVHDFSHEEWDAKKRHFQQAQELIPHVHVCRVYAGLFLEDSIGPWFGFFTKNAKYEAVGSPSQRTSYTSKYDVGQALAILASSPQAAIPAEVHLSGDSKSLSEIAAIMEEHGAGRIEVSSVPLESYKAKVLAKASPTPERYLRFLMGEGKIDHTDEGLGNQNGVIAGDDGLGSWKLVVDLAKETDGRPWADYDWKSID